MSDDRTDKIELSSLGSTSSQEIMRQLNQNVNDLIKLLNSQRDLLQARGMSLPSGSLDSLRTFKMRLDALSRQQLNAQLELRRLRELAETTALINSSLETDAVLNQVMDTVINLTGAERGYIVLKNKETGELDLFAVARGLDREQLTSRIVSWTIVNEVGTTGQPVLTDNASQDERYQDQKSVVGHALRSILAVPLKVRGEIIGVVYCDNRILSGLFQQHDLDLLTAFANQSAVAIENARLFESARQRIEQLTEMRDLINNIFESITSGVLTVDDTGMILTCNSAALTIIGAEAAVGSTLDQVMPPLPQFFYDTLSEVFESGTQQLIEVQTYPEAGSPSFWNVVISPLSDAAGNLEGLALVLDDLTEQKMREETLAEVRRYLPLALVENIRSIDDVNVSGQEREITSISTDVRGFTTFSERLPPEQLMEIINKYLSVASDAINLYEGIVDKYMGDAVTGLFNTQLNPQEDHAVRAVRAAMSIIYDLYALHEILPEDQRLYYGIGVHTGPAFLGNVGSEDRKEFTALGEATTISKILEGNAGPGEVIISPATYEHVKAFFECEERVPDQAKTKGRDDITLVYKVVGRKKGAHTGQLFVDPELAELLKDLGTGDS